MSNSKENRGCLGALRDITIQIIAGIALIIGGIGGVVLANRTDLLDQIFQNHHES